MNHKKKKGEKPVQQMGIKYGDQGRIRVEENNWLVKQIDR